MTVAAAVEARLAALNMLEAAHEDGNDLQLLAAQWDAENALHALVQARQLDRLYNGTGGAPKWNAEWREDDVLPLPEGAA